MVKNGYILNVSTNNIASFLDKVRLELKNVVREQVLMQTAKSTEFLLNWNCSISSRISFVSF
ncbi:MAG TPA: hypothetical protein H9672_05085 [Firmicutes bacterium]|nr:hypothetical protein [Bacillota bacterium]